MLRRSITAIVAVALLAAAGCSTNTELSGTRLPNARPDTRISGQPPTLLEASFVVEFNWTGADPDGRIAGYQWKISDNGVDGISPRDTLTFDPLTGAELNPWRFTTATDSTFLVLADQADFPSDDPDRGPRSYRTHSIFVRAVDEKGAVDPTPAYMTFTSTTIVPTARAVFPNLSNQGASTVPPTVNLGWEGKDEDFELRVPTRVRYLWKRAQLEDGTDIRTPFEYNLYYDELIDFDDPDWSVWQAYSADEENRKASFPRQPPDAFFLFAVQVQDTAGAVSVGRRYQVEVAHVLVKEGSTAPYPTLTETYLPLTHSIGKADIAADQPLNFAWTATAAQYNGNIVSYRHGWDLISVDDPNDPGWAVPPGLSEANLSAQEQRFAEGVHTFWLRVEDDAGQVSIVTYLLNVIPYVDYNLQAQLLVIDQVVDDQVQNWPDQQGRPRNSEVYRNEYWSFLQSQPGGVLGLDWVLDRRDHTQNVNYRDLVGYKAVLCYAQVNERQVTMMNKFRPANDVDKFVWLAPYQQRGGNLMLVGGGSMDSFIEVKPNYMTPFVFTSREPDWVSGTTTFVVSYRVGRTPDNEEYERGVLAYPYATAGISALDWTSSNTKYVYARPRSIAKEQREVDCVGLKGVRIDPAFKSHWSIPPGAFPDTIWTDTDIDWQDQRFVDGDTSSFVQNTFPFRDDEFVNADIAGRGQWAEQLCPDDPNAPGGLCIEPMFRGISRFDWLRELKWRQGNTGWPANRYTQNDLDDLCGPVALSPYGTLPRGTSKTNGKTYGYLSYKMTTDKPSGAPDVYWGFDPYRFEQGNTKNAIRWVLKELFQLQVLDP